MVKSVASGQADLCDLRAVKPPLQASVLSSVKRVHYHHRVCLTWMSVSVRIAINTARVTVTISIWLFGIKCVVTSGLSSSALPQATWPLGAVYTWELTAANKHPHPESPSAASASDHN